MGGIYKEQKEFIFPTSENHKSCKKKKLIILHNFTSLESCACIMREMKDTSTDIIVVTNELFCKEEIAKDFKKYLDRACNIIEVTNLESINIKQRILFGLLEKNDFVAEESDHIVFTLLSEYSQGAATIVHMLTSLMQKCSNNRTSFEIIKQQLNIIDQGSQVLQESEMSIDSQYSNKEEQKPILFQNLCMFIKDMLQLSLPAYCMLKCLSIFTPLSLPLFYITELDNLIKNDMNKEHAMFYESLVTELKDNGVIRSYPNPLVYHNNFNPKCVDPNAQLMFIPKLISDAVKTEMNYDDKANAISYTQCALKIVMAKNSSSPYIRILQNHLQKFCIEQEIK